MHSRSLIFVCFALLGATTFGAESTPAATQPAAVKYSVQSMEKEPLFWGGFLTLTLQGTIAGNWVDENQWKISLNGLPVKVRKVYAGDSDGAIRFILDRPEGGIDAAGVVLLGKSRFSANMVKAQVDFAGRRLEPSSDGANVVWMTNVHPSRAKAFLVIVLCVVVLLLWTIFRTGILRDGNKAIPDPKLRPFSLAKSQLAVWITVVMLGYVLLFLLTGNSLGIFNTTALTLIGIGTLTTGIASTWGSNPATPAAVTPTPAVDPATPVPAPAPAPAPTNSSQQSEGILDLISDAEGPNIHRLQMALWTLVFAGVFVTKLLDELVFPTFDAQTFYLMGISSATYVWFKRSEKSPASSP